DVLCATVPEQGVDRFRIVRGEGDRTAPGEPGRKQVAHAFEQRAGAPGVLRRGGLVEKQGAAWVGASAGEREREEQALPFAPGKPGNRRERIEESSPHWIVAEPPEKIPDHEIGRASCRERGRNQGGDDRAS